MESKKINQLATELSPALDDLTIIGDPTTGISRKITLSQMASLFTGTVEEYASLAAFPLVGATDTIYIALDTNILYRWSGTAYVELSPNIVSSLVFSDANGFDGTITLVGSVATLSITTALTLGSLPFIGASGALTQDNTNLFYDDTNNRLGIGTNEPTTPLDVFGSGIISRINGTSTNNGFLGFSNAGTNKWSVGNVQSDHRFRIFSEANSAELVSLLQTGEFGIGIANPTTKLHLDGGATALIANLDANVSVAKSLSFRSDNSNRINLEVSGTESGSNAGANFFIRRYSDAGALIDTPLTITRSTGAISLATTLNLSEIQATTSAGITLKSNGGTSVALFGAGGGAGTTLYGGLIGTSASFSGDLTIDTNTLYVDSTNNRVGIGTVSPSVRLQVLGGTITTNTQSTYAFGVGNSSGYDLTFGTDASFAYIQSWGSRPLQINNQGNNLILNATAGNVLIGSTTDGGARLQVNGRHDAAGTIRSTSIASAAAGSGAEMLFTGGIGYFIAYNRTTDAYLPVNINGSTVTISTGASGTPALTLASTGAATFSSTLTAGSDIISQLSTANDIRLLINPTATAVKISATYNTTGSYQPLTFLTSDTERMRITSAGDALVGMTSATSTSVTSVRAGLISGQTSSSSSAGLQAWNQATSGDNKFVEFYTESGGSTTLRGTIDYNRAAGLVRYNTTSDANLKNIIGDSNKQKSIDILNSTKIREYSWKSDETNKSQIGVIAQELYETYKGAVSKGSDSQLLGTDEYKNWQVDKTAFTFHLIAGFQEHERIIKELKAEIDILKNK
jgi:hypothetical protein